MLDLVVTGIRRTRNHAYLVFDTLYGIDTSWMAQPQMVEGHHVEEDGLIWTLTLRDGLRFHDKEPVLARDVVASIRRFAARISFAYAQMAATEELSAPDDRTVRFQLKRPFPHLLLTVNSMSLPARVRRLAASREGIRASPRRWVAHNDAALGTSQPEQLSELPHANRTLTRPTRSSA